MPDVAYELAEIAANAMKWQKQAVHRYIGGVEHKTWKPAAGKLKARRAEFWPMIEALPSKFVMSLGENRLTIYVRGTRQHPIIDGVDIIGSTEPFDVVIKAWSKPYQSVVTEIGRQQLWNRENPMYQTQNPNMAKTGKSKLNPSQLTVGS